MLLVLYPVTAKRLRQLFEFMKLGEQRRPLCTGKVFSGIFLKGRRQSIRLVRLEIHGPFRRVSSDFFLNMVAHLMFPGVPLKRANPSGHFNGIMTAYAAYNEGRMSDSVPTDEELQPSIDALPTIPGIQE